MIAAAVGGAKYGTAILWAALVGALIKFTLNEGLARWQLATGTTLLEGWQKHLGPLVVYGFLVYLFIWSFIVAGALMAACGLAAAAIYPVFSVNEWAVLHSIVAALLVYFGRYSLFENLMKFFIGMMFILVLWCAFTVGGDWSRIATGLTWPHIPNGSAKFLLGVIGGVGGSVTLLSYSYWMREKGWKDASKKSLVRIDLGVAYLLTGVFGVAVMIISSGVNPEVITGSQMVIALADQIGTGLGSGVKWLFLCGFWGAVFSSMLGVWQGVPYLFSDFIRIHRGSNSSEWFSSDRHNRAYHGYLLFLAVPPMILLAFGKPVWLVIAYAISGALFMPFLAGTLLYLNNQQKMVGKLKNRWLINLGLVAGLLVFATLAIFEISGRI